MSWQGITLPGNIGPFSSIPDGIWLSLSTGSDLYAIRPGVDSIPIPLVVTDASERLPTLSPDGRWLAYVSNVSGRQEVYVRPFPKVTEAMWQVSTTGGTEPRWAHSGRELFFRNEAGEFVAAPIAAGATFEWGEPRSLILDEGVSNRQQWPHVGCGPGDQRFLMLRPDHGRRAVGAHRRGEFLRGIEGAGKAMNSTGLEEIMLTIVVDHGMI